MDYNTDEFLKKIREHNNQQQASLDANFDEFNKIINSEEVKSSMARAIANHDNIEKLENERINNVIEWYKDWCSREKTTLEDKYSYWIDYIADKFYCEKNDEMKKINTALSNINYFTISDIIKKVESEEFYNSLVSYLKEKKEKEENKESIQQEIQEKRSSIVKKFNNYINAFISYSEGRLYTNEQEKEIAANNEKLDKLNIRLKNSENTKKVPIIGSLLAKKVSETEDEIKRIKSISKKYADENLMMYCSELKEELESYASISDKSDYERLMFELFSKIIEIIISYRSQLEIDKDINENDIMLNIAASTKKFDYEKYMLNPNKPELYTTLDILNPENYFEQLRNTRQIVVYNNNLLKALGFIVKNFINNMRKFDKQELNSMLNDVYEQETSDDKNKKNSY